ncbi:MAG TPA: hypothetical protein VN648_12645 [Candidatus Methylomirabilis sp.]|nr:hypothetical protein [Candidatus Methylomirabilis sp.]
MPFAYYQRLTRAQQRIYRQSDEIAVIRVPAARAFHETVDALAEALQKEDRPATQAMADRLLAGMTTSLGVPPVRVQVLAARPSHNWGELHGLYTPGEDGRPSRATVWMRTAQRRRVVRFRTFLRTLLHELCHHLDYELLRLPDSFHTEGFYKRESSLLRQLLDERLSGEGTGNA